MSVKGDRDRGLHACVGVCVCVTQSMELISLAPPSPVESLIKSLCWGFSLTLRRHHNSLLEQPPTWPTILHTRSERLITDTCMSHFPKTTQCFSSHSASDFSSPLHKKVTECLYIGV